MIQNVDIHHVESHESSWGICKKLHRFHVDYDPGVVALISGKFILGRNKKKDLEIFQNNFF